MKWLPILIILFTYTLNSTNTWEIVTNDTLNNDINAVFFINENTGWAVGSNGKIIKTVDNGKNWITQLSKTTQDLNSVFFINEKTGWAVGGINGNNGDTGNAKIINTTDGGNNWTSQLDIEDYKLNCIFMVNENIGYVGGGYYGNRPGTIYKTFNGGVKWGKISSSFLPSESIVNSIYFINDTIGWAVGSFKEKANGKYSIIKKTTNGGATWNNLIYKKVSRTLNSVFFLDENRGWAVGAEGLILQLHDNGEVWNDTLSIPGYYDKIQFVDKGNGFIIRANGNVMQTSNGGESWVIETVQNEYYIKNAFILNNDNIWGINTIGKDGRNNYIVKYSKNTSSVDNSISVQLIYPNPANDYVVIPSSNYSIYNSQGIHIGDYKYSTLDITSYPTGVYFVITGNSMYKFIK